MTERTYKIGEAAQILKLKSYVLRFWETEFPQLTPMRTGKGQRLYSEADLELLKFIRHLLHERGLTIEGARKVLQTHSEMTDPDISGPLLTEGYSAFTGDGSEDDVLQQYALLAPEVPVSGSEATYTIGEIARRAELESCYDDLQYVLEELKNIGKMLSN